MSDNIGSIDDLLTQSQNSSTPKTPEYIDDNNDTDSNNHDYSAEPDAQIEHGDEDNGDDVSEDNQQERHYDEYGTEKPAPKTYTEDEVNERINKAVRERLARANHNTNQQATPQQQQQIQQQVKDFEYDPESGEGWQQQLEAFVEQTFTKMTQKQVQRQAQERERAAEAEFVDKFSTGMERFQDFVEVVGPQPVTEHMTLALRGIQDPTAFIYAASKRHPQELERISKLQDPYKQMVEIGKLEERMRKKPEGTRAPRPIGRSQEDSTMNYVEKKQQKEDSIEDLISKAEQKKLAKMRQLRGK
jgi:hypothetical protein